MKEHPYFTTAWRTELRYCWDSRTVPGVLQLLPVEGKQSANVTTQSPERTPAGEPTLMIRAMGEFPARSFANVQGHLAAQGDFCGAEFLCRAPHGASIRFEFLGKSASCRVKDGWTKVRLEVPVAHDISEEQFPMLLHFEEMHAEERVYIGPLTFFLRTDRAVPKPEFPAKVIRAGKTWKPCDLSDLYVKKGTVLDFSSFFPQEDFDRLGRVVPAPDGHFTYENAPQKRLRFLGHSMALTRSTIPETHAEIDAFADALRNQGYNLVRIHGVNALLMDASNGWDGTLPDTPEAIPVLPGAEERLQYFIYALRQRGIHLYLDMCTFINGWHTGDVWINCGIWIENPEGPTRYATQFLLRDPAVRANFRAGVLRVMTRKNPYTGLTPAGDPTVAFVLGFNELLISECRELVQMRQERKLPEAELQYEILEETAQFIDSVIRETGYRGIINQYDNSRKLLNLAVGSRYDSVMNHVYHWCPHKFFYPGSSQGASSALFSGLGYLRQAARLRPAGKCYGISEYGEAYWNNHRFAQGMNFGCYSALQDFDALIMHSTPVMKQGGELRPFSGGNDPAARVAEVITACAFLRGDVKKAAHSAVWEFDKAFLMENFGKLTESTDSFAALLLKIGFAYERTVQADFRYPQRIAAPGEYFGPEFRKKFPGSELVNGLVAKMREKGMLSAENRTDPAKGIYQSETGELTVDLQTESMTVSAPRLEGAVVPEKASEKLAHLEILPGDAESVVALISQDGTNDLDHCRRALFVCGTNALNTESSFLIRDDDALITDTEGRSYRHMPGEEVLLDNGHVPVLRRNRAGDFRLRLPGIQNPVVWSVRFNGERHAVIPAKRAGEWLCFHLECADDPSPFYEVAERAE